jgi:hypothetical protein
MFGSHFRSSIGVVVVVVSRDTPKRVLPSLAGA